MSGMTETNYNPENLIADSHPTVTTGITVVEEAQGLKIANLSRGQILGRRTADGKYRKYNPLNDDGSQVARLILADNIIASAVTSTNCLAFAHGVFNSNALFGFDSAAKQKLMDVGIFTKEIK